MKTKEARENRKGKLSNVRRRSQDTENTRKRPTCFRPGMVTMRGVRPDTDPGQKQIERQQGYRSAEPVSSWFCLFLKHGIQQPLPNRPLFGTANGSLT